MTTTTNEPAQSWIALRKFAAERANATIARLFEEDPSRGPRLQLSHAGLTLDFSKNTADQAVFQALAALLDDSRTQAAMRALKEGEPLNNTEHRPALHTAIRAALAGESAPSGQQLVEHHHRAMRFADRLHRGAARGYAGTTITDVVNIGIGGSDLGPRLVTSALESYCKGACRIHFVSSLDDQELAGVLAGLRPADTLFLVSSKSFGTEETLCNARAAMDWFRRGSGQSDLGDHFAALTGNAEPAVALGISAQQIFHVPDGVGGRYSIWSSSGLAAMIALGSEGFSDFLAGAHAMDQNAGCGDLTGNMAAVLAALEIWHSNLLDYRSAAVIPYSYSLRLLPAYLQQLVMESNGKSCDRSGQALQLTSAPVVWGTAGTEGQHSYHQLLHQGTQVVPVDFILPLRGPSPDRTRRLASHCLAQSKALMEGKSERAAYEELLAQSMPPDQAQQLAPHKAMPGNRPSNTLLMDALTPATLGALIALYEHKTFFTSVVWNINPFDQWGVELGKQLSKAIYATFSGDDHRRYDSSTDALLQAIQTQLQ